MKKMNLVRFISTGGILTAIAVIFQSAPVFFPVFGLALSPLSTLPIAIAAYQNISLGISVFFSSAFLLTLISTQEALILLFTTGLLGVVIGALIYNKRFLVSILLTSIILSLGIIVLTYIVGIPAFGDFMGTVLTPLSFFIYFTFSFIYSSIFYLLLRKLFKYLVVINSKNDT